uniref:Uncharacterized protein n=1 Tax=Timema cristinae TaxID=61476 RepID=A0A7R9D534_TIMCR|nr:unnamed protein product [Timema cristinae]
MDNSHWCAMFVWTIVTGALCRLDNSHWCAMSSGQSSLVRNVVWTIVTGAPCRLDNSHWCSITMRRASYTPLPQQSEPLIVVEESGGTDDEDESPTGGGDTPQLNLAADSPLLNPCLLSPYRDMRKRSLPTPQCTTGITASQVRRLSEHGGETAATAGREAAFLATLSSGPAPAQGGRRHSVVTISRAPPTGILFGRNRRESIAVFPSSGGMSGRVLPPRRDSCSAVPPPPPSTASTTGGGGSTFNLQLDIMDDIAEIKAARKVRLKMWQGPGGRDKMCEVQPMDAEGGATPTRYTTQQHSGTSLGAPPIPMTRRYSDFVTAPPGVATQQHPRRRASEQVHGEVSPTPGTSSGRSLAAGIVCSNTDLISILSSLATSSQEINRYPEDQMMQQDTSASSSPGGKSLKKSSGVVEQKRKKLKDLRSNSFDISMLLGAGAGKPTSPGGGGGKSGGGVGPSSWFTKRHQPRKTSDVGAAIGVKVPQPVVVTFQDDKTNVSLSQAEVVVPPPTEAAAALTRTEEDVRGEPASRETGTTAQDHKVGVQGQHIRQVMWDGKSGSVVDAQMLGSAIEVFLARKGSGNEIQTPPTPPPRPSPSPSKVPGSGAAPPGSSTWFPNKTQSQQKQQEEDEASASDSCDTSLCATLKDLFVK